MQKEAYKLTGFTVIMAAVGFLVRWLQGMQIYDEVTGLADRSAGVNFWLTAIVVITAGLLAAAVILLKRCKAMEGPGAMVGRSPLHTVVGVVAGLALALSGLLMAVTFQTFDFPKLRLVLGLVTAAAGVCAIQLTVQGGRSGREGARQLFSVVLVLFGCLWMVVTYKENAANPVIWSFAMEILALCAATLAFYFAAGYQFGQSQPLRSIYFSYLGTFLCMICIIDSHSGADAVGFAGLTLLLGMWAFVQTQNMVKPDKGLGIHQ